MAVQYQNAHGHIPKTEELRKNEQFQLNMPKEKMSEETRADCEMLCGYIKNLRGHGIPFTESLQKGK